MRISSSTPRRRICAIGLELLEDAFFTCQASRLRISGRYPPHRLRRRLPITSIEAESSSIASVAPERLYRSHFCSLWSSALTGPLPLLRAAPVVETFRGASRG